MPQVSIPALNFTVPTDIPQKYQEFLARAAQDPDIIKYYSQLLDYAKGDLSLAQSQLEQGYQTGVRQTKDTLRGSLDQLGLMFGKEQQGLESNLNQRGIAMTDIGGGKVAYAAGGQPATELGQLNDSQRLRQEAEQRSASQNIQNAGLKLQSGLASAGQSARNQGLNYEYQQKQDIYNRAQIPYQNYLNNQFIDAQKALAKQQQGGSSGQADGDPKNMTQQHRQSLWDASGKTGIAPVGYGGG